MDLTSIFKKYGVNVTLENKKTDTTQSYKAFVQALRYKNKMYMRGVQTRLGRIHQGYYVYVGPAEYDLTSGAADLVVTIDGGAYTVDRAEKMRLENKVVYMWAILSSTQEAEI